MSSSIGTYFSQVLAYKGGLGHWSWVLHRLTGIGIFSFLVLHIFDIYIIGFGPEPFNTLAVLYHHPAMRIGHIFLFFSVLFHAVNGVRIVILDLWPDLWKHQKTSVWIAFLVIAVLFIPSAILILNDTLSSLGGAAH